MNPGALPDNRAGPCPAHLAGLSLPPSPDFPSIGGALAAVFSRLAGPAPPWTIGAVHAIKGKDIAGKGRTSWTMHNRARRPPIRPGTTR